MNRVCESDLSLGEQLALIKSRKSSKKILHYIPKVEESEIRTIDQSGRLDKRTVAIFKLIGGTMKDVYNFVDEACNKSIKMTVTARKYGIQEYTVHRARFNPDGFIDTYRNVVRVMKDRGIYE